MIQTSCVNYFKTIKARYGPETRQRVRQYETQCYRAARLKSQEDYLKNCKRNGVCPPTLRAQLPPTLKNDPGLTRHLDRLNLACVRRTSIRARREWANSRKIENELWCDIQMDMTAEDAKKLDEIVSKNSRNEKSRADITHDKKLHALIEKKWPESVKTGSEKVINKSKAAITNVQKSVLSRGLNFCMPPRVFPTLDYITAVEGGAYVLAPEKKSEWKRKIATEIEKHLKFSPTTQNLTQPELHALDSLAKDKTVKVLKADKGGAVVVLDAEEYDKKMCDLLAGEEYQELEGDPSEKLERKLRSVLSGYDDLKHLLPPARAAGLKLPVNKPPHIYGLPKIHKDGAPLRPIVSTVGSTFQPIARYLVGILSPLAGRSTISIKNADEILPKLRELRLSRSDKICSLDVKSLFTSVPREKTLKIVEDKLKNDPTLIDRTSLTADKICQLLAFCMESTFFQFKHNFYIQTKGLAMGSSLSPILAEIYMQEHEKICLERFPHAPKMICRYVDDYFLVVGRNFQINNFLSTCNSIDVNIQLTLEMENNGQLPFLDMLLKREDGKLSISVYRKATNTNTTLHFQSCHSLATKIAVATNMFHRAYKYCNSPLSLNNEINTLYKILKSNGYPLHTINKAHNKAKTKLNTPPPPPPPSPPIAATNTPEPQKTTICFPYVPKISEKIKNITYKITNNIRVAFKSGNTLRKKLMHVKPKSCVAPNHCVYEISCSNCPAIYIGETERVVNSRLREHETAVKKKCNLDEAEADKNFSRIGFHAQKENHEIDFASATVIKFEKRKKRRKLIEALAMKTRQAQGAHVISMPSYHIDETWSAFLKTPGARDFFKNKTPVPTATNNRRGAEVSQTKDGQITPPVTRDEAAVVRPPGRYILRARQ